MNEREKPPENFTDVSDHTRQFISRLGPEDLATLEWVLSIFTSVRGWCRINRWIFFGCLAVLVGVWQGVEAVRHISTLLKHWMATWQYAH